LLTVNTKQVKVIIQDEIFWDAYEEISIKLDRKPTCEEVEQFLKEKFKISEEERVKYNKEKYV